MDVLFLTAKAQDFLQDLVLDGLVKVLGREHVIVHPVIDRYVSAPPGDYRYLGMQYLELGEEARSAAPLAELVASVDAIVVGGVRGEAEGHLLEVMALASRPPIAVLDGWDDPYVRGAIRYADVYFKRETLRAARGLQARMPVRRLVHRLRRRSDWLDPLRRQVQVATTRVSKLVPLPFGIIDTGFVPEDGWDHDVAFLGAATSPQRLRLVEQLRALRAEGYRVVLPDDPAWEHELWHAPTRLPWNEYMRLLSRTRLCLSVRGAGYDTYRYWEVPYAGSVLLSETPRTVIADDFVPGREAFYAETEHLGETARRLLADDLSAVAAAGRAKVMRCHTSVQRGALVAERLDDLLRRARRGAPRRSSESTPRPAIR